MIIFADIAARDRIEPYGKAVRLSRSGNEPATHCYVRTLRTRVDSKDGLVRSFDQDIDAVLNASGLKEIGTAGLKQIRTGLLGWLASRG